MNYFQRLTKSRTCRLALYKQLAGAVAIISANLGYFESTVTVTTFGVITIVLGLADHWLRVQTEGSIK